MLEKMLDKRIFLIFCGLGYPRVDEFVYNFPNRAINVESSEQTALDIAVGLAYEGKIPFVYTITPFFYRGFETIRTYINHEKLHVILVGSGRDNDYKEDGISHDATDFGDFIHLFENIAEYYPGDAGILPEMINNIIISKGPSFLSLRK